MTATSSPSTGPSTGRATNPGRATSTGQAANPGQAASTGERAVPYCCPFCAEEDLLPLESGAVPGLSRGGWHCRSCLRVFSISFHGLHQPVLPSSARPANSGDWPPLESDRS
jgi:hypothetical protein